MYQPPSSQHLRHFTRQQLRRLHLAALRFAGGTEPTAPGAAPGRRPAGGRGRSRSHGGDGSGGSNGAAEAGGLGSFR